MTPRLPRKKKKMLKKKLDSFYFNDTLIKGIDCFKYNNKVYLTNGVSMAKAYNVKDNKLISLFATMPYILNNESGKLILQ